MKAYAISQLSAKMQELQAQWNVAISDYNNVLNQLGNNRTTNEINSALKSDPTKSYNKILSLGSQIKQLGAGISTVDKVFGGLQTKLDGYTAAFTGGNFKPSNVGGSSGSSPSSGATSTAKDDEEDYQAERLKMEQAANSKIEDLRNKLVSALKKKYDDLRKKELEPLEKEIQMKQDELAKLRGEDNDSEKKLKALEAELALWEKNDSAFSKEKIEDLKKQIKDVQLDLKEAELNKEIEDLEKKKETINSKYDALLEEEKIYAEASKMIQENKFEEMKSLLTSYGEDFKEISTILGQSIVDIITTELKALKDAYDFLKGTKDSYTDPTNKYTSPSSSGSTSSSGSSSSTSKPSSSSSSSSSAISTGSKIKVKDNSSPIYYTSTSTSNSGTWKGAGVSTTEGLYVVNTNNGKAALSRTNSINGAIGWIDMGKIAKFKVGGDVGTWGAGTDDGKLAMVHSGERVLTAEQNKAFSDLVYKIIPQLQSIPSQILEKFKGLSNTKTNNNNSSIVFKSDYDVTNKTEFDVRKFQSDVVKEIMKNLNKSGIRTTF